LRISGVGAFVIAWHLAIGASGSSILPTPKAVFKAIAEVAQKGLLLRYVVASLFRVTWGYLTAVALAVPIGLCLGWYRRAEKAVSPYLQILRPISPLAWIPIAILWFGVGDQGTIFIVFLGSFFPLTIASMAAARSVHPTYINVGRNFGYSDFRMLIRIVYPAALPKLIVALRVALGIAWLVVVAGEMIAVNSGLGFLIVESRNAGNRYDLVVAGMVLIGVIGMALDTGMRRFEALDLVRWSFAPGSARRSTRVHDRLENNL
jgi:NitT/TauT family transport system permease protein